MRKIAALILAPLLLAALEKVNIIKDAGFENDSYNWLEVAGGESPTDTAIANRHDEEKAFSGSYSGSCNTLIPGQYPIHGDSAILVQSFPVAKSVSSIDSLSLNFSVIPRDNLWTRAEVVEIVFCINSQDPNFQNARYIIKASDIFYLNPPSYFVILDTLDFPPDTDWYSLVKDVKADLLENNVLPDSKIDKFYLLSGGVYFSPWRGQKVYWDGIRLTGYADYDVGVKGFLSDDSIGDAYTPTARIKNFGRKPADSFLVIATIEDGSGVVYADTLSWSLASDTEDTVSFKEFEPSDAANYTLTVSTFMTPDECDEDDEMSKTFYCSGINEQISPQGLSFQIDGMLRAALSSIRYSIPSGEQGTINLYDPAGRIVESHPVTGSGEVRFESRLASGVYFVKLETGHMSLTRKVIVILPRD